MSCQNGRVNSEAARILLDEDTLQLAERLALENTTDDIVRLISTLRAEGHPPERVHHALEQVRLRRKAAKKLGPFADRMLFTEDGLEQATRLQVAAHHAGRFARAGFHHVADLGCGLGVDAMAIASLGIRVSAVERDEVTAALAAYNLAPFDTTTVYHSTAEEFDLTDVDALWMDPARRSEGHRLTDPSDWSPSLDTVFSLASTHPAGIKLAPGIDRSLLPPDCEWQWVSSGGEVVEVTVWTGALARDGVGRAALVISGDRAAELTSESDSVDAPVGPLGEFLYEPDGAVIRARLIGQLARSLSGHMIDSTIAYITADTEQATPLAQGFRVEQVLPVKIPALKQWAREAGIGSLEIKKRGIDVDPATLRKQLELRGDAHATLILTRMGGRKVAVVARRLQPEGPTNP